MATFYHILPQDYYLHPDWADPLNRPPLRQDVVRHQS